MKWFYKLERRFGNYAIPRLMNYIIVLYALGLILAWFKPGFFETWLALDAAKIFQGQIWRIVTFLIDPPSTSIIFALLILLLYYQIGNALEMVWGAFRFNVYFFMGIIGNVAAAILYFLITGFSIPMGTVYLNLSLFLAYALTFPDMQFMIMFIIPIKAKYLAYLDLALYALMVIGAIAGHDWGTVVEIVVSLLNFVVFMILTRGSLIPTRKTIKQRAKFKSEVSRARVKANTGRHICHVCGATELDDPNLTFRYCSKCEGNYEYCEKHLYTHIHVTKNDLLNMK